MCIKNTHTSTLIKYIGSVHILHQSCLEILYVRVQDEVLINISLHLELIV